MPYIIPPNRKRFDKLVDGLVEALTWDNVSDYPENFEVGELNYALSTLIWKLWKKHPRYSRGNGLMGVLSCVQNEFYRRQLAPHEDAAMAMNGDLETEPGGGG